MQEVQRNLPSSVVRASYRIESRRGQQANLSAQLWWPPKHFLGSRSAIIEHRKVRSSEDWQIKPQRASWDDSLTWINSKNLLLPREKSYLQRSGSRRDCRQPNHCRDWLDLLHLSLASSDSLAEVLSVRDIRLRPRVYLHQTIRVNWFKIARLMRTLSSK